MDILNLQTSNNANKDFHEPNQEILLELDKELVQANIVDELKYIPAQKVLKIIFSNHYDNVALDIKGDPKNWYVYTSKIEEKIKKYCPNLNSNQLILIENTIKKNINLIVDAADDHLKNQREQNQKEEDESKGAKKCYLRKYEINKKLYESILINNTP